MKSKLIALAIFTFGLTACEKTVPLDLNQAQSQVTIEGQVTNLPDHNYVKITKSVGFYDTGKSPRVKNATVSVEDDNGNIFNFVHYQGSSEDSIGYYFPAEPFAGEIGRTYNLNVVVDGEAYTAQDKLFHIIPFDKLEYRIDKDEQEDPEDPGRFYEVLLFVKEPKETEDFYLFKFYRNGNLEYGSETDIYFSDDKLLSESIDGIPAPIYYAKDDVSKIEAYSLSNDAFIYYRDLQKVLNNDGGLFGSPPANPRSNISNGALGFFQVSAIQSGEITISE